MTETLTIDSSIGELTLTRFADKIKIKEFKGWIETMKVSKKTVRCLEDKDGAMCCLGAFCKSIGREFQKDGRGKFLFDGGQKNYGFLPEGVRSHYGFNSNNGDFSEVGVIGQNKESLSTALASINDLLESDEDFTAMIEIINFFFCADE